MNQSLLTQLCINSRAYCFSFILDKATNPGEEKLRNEISSIPLKIEIVLDHAHGG